MELLAGSRYELRQHLQAAAVAQAKRALAAGEGPVVAFSLELEVRRLRWLPLGRGGHHGHGVQLGHALGDARREPALAERRGEGAGVFQEGARALAIRWLSAQHERARELVAEAGEVGAEPARVGAGLGLVEVAHGVVELAEHLGEEAELAAVGRLDEVAERAEVIEPMPVGQEDGVELARQRAVAQDVRGVGEGRQERCLLDLGIDRVRAHDAELCGGARAVACAAVDAGNQQLGDAVAEALQRLLERRAHARLKARDLVVAFRRAADSSARAPAERLAIDDG